MFFWMHNTLLNILNAFAKIIPKIFTKSEFITFADGLYIYMLPLHVFIFYPSDMLETHTVVMQETNCPHHLIIITTIDVIFLFSDL